MHNTTCHHANPGRTLCRPAARPRWLSGAPRPVAAPAFLNASHPPACSFPQEAARRARERAAGLSADAGFLEGDGTDGDGADGEGGGGGGGREPDAAALEKAYMRDLAKEVAGAAGGGSGDDDDGSGDDGDGERAPRPAAGGVYTEEEMAAMMMSRKQRKFYERIKRAQAGKAERVGALEARKAALDAAEGRAPAARPARGAAKRAPAAEQQRVETIEPTMKKRRK